VFRPDLMEQEAIKRNILISLENLKKHTILQREDGLFQVIKNDTNEVVRDGLKNEWEAGAVARFLETEIYPDNKDGVLNFRANNIYPDATEEQLPFVKVLDQYGYGEKKIKKFFNKLDIPDHAEIPAEEWEIDSFKFKILEKTDPLGAVLGNITSCCQTIEGFGSDCVYDGYNNPRSGFLVVYDKKGMIVSQSWIRFGQSGTLYLDNIETAGIYDESLNKNKENADKLRGAYIDWASKVKKERNYEGISVGSGYSDITFPGKKETRKYKKKEEFQKSHDLYTDIKKEVYRIASVFQKRLQKSALLKKPVMTKAASDFSNIIKAWKEIN
ncbi:MAG TPA: hypothetical protein VMZ91_12255, partial [Candidatus Paceibacterota bacterium]|nr:hypothetical protein [Candidatus Paceibacterota bacterium]